MKNCEFTVILIVYAMLRSFSISSEKIDTPYLVKSGYNSILYQMTIRML